nr:ferredoxin-dependent glutamate synthase, chloroplastic [Tanacetum cinerariifolium]
MASPPALFATIYGVSRWWSVVVVGDLRSVQHKKIVAGNKMVGQNVSNASTYVKGGIERRFEASAGQSHGCFLTPGMNVQLIEANEYVGNVAAK